MVSLGDDGVITMNRGDTVQPPALTMMYIIKY